MFSKIPVAGAVLDAVIILAFSGLLAHQDIDKTIFMAVVLPIVGARLAALKQGANTSGALSLLLGLSALLSTKSA